MNIEYYAYCLICSPEDNEHVGSASNYLESLSRGKIWDKQEDVWQLTKTEKSNTFY